MTDIIERVIEWHHGRPRTLYDGDRLLVVVDLGGGRRETTTVIVRADDDIATLRYDMEDGLFPWGVDDISWWAKLEDDEMPNRE